ncbi:glycosyltransferase family 1 protein [Sphingorhabdus soli]|uniref:Glycosyltransferase family 1 protein n=1 Tax=Flavisphingopyxis soli TaxID=2601267 RepID=A0A5C6U8R6_9SPHN|nr:glycosyltransferase [Sphingorhabdus soli]TXC69272.1 glycosyltransferase family 1 protein [Sphingorhabdus soli]
MRIVDVCSFYAPAGGGVKTYIDRKLQSGAANGCEIVIVAPGSEATDRRISDFARFVTIPSPRFPLDRRYRYFNDEGLLHETLDRLAPDVVEASSPWSSAVMTARWPGAAVKSLVMHSDPLSTFAYRWLDPVFSRRTIDSGFRFYWDHLRRMDEQFDMVVCASQDLTDRLSAGGLRRAVTMPMGVEPGIFSPARRDPALRRMLLEQCYLPETATLLLGVGRWSPEKRWKMVVEACAAAGASHPVALLLVGAGREHRAIADAIGGNPHIRMVPAMTDRVELATLMASGDALVHGCESETFGMVAAEARASGLPLIVPDAGGAAEQAIAADGLVYRATSAIDLARAIGQFIAGGVGAARMRALAKAGATPDMDEHFARLFARYRDHLERCHAA